MNHISPCSKTVKPFWYYHLKTGNTRLARQVLLIFLLGLACLKASSQQTITYSQSFTGGQSYATGSPQYDGWTTFCTQLTSRPYTSVTIKGTNSAAGVTLTDPVAVASLAAALNTGGSYSNGTWSVGNCGGGSEITNVGSICSCPSTSSSFTCRPKIGNQNWGGVAGATCGAATQVITVQFVYTNSSPAITSFTPANGCAGTNISITGTNFTGATAVSVGGTPVSSFTVNSATSITAVLGSGSTGTISITAPGGSASSSSSFTVGNTIPYAYLANGSGNPATMKVINTVSNNLITTITGLGNGPQGVSVSPDKSKVYITNFYSNNVSVVSTASNTVIATIAVGNGPRGVCVSPDNTKVYVANYSSGSVSVINAATNTVTATITGLPITVNGICISPDGSKVYVSVEQGAAIDIINTSTNTFSSAIFVGNYPRSICLSADGSKLYAANWNDNTVSVINTSTNTVTTTVTGLTAGPQAICVSPDGSKLYAASGNGNAVDVVNTVTNTVTATISVSNYPTGISISADGSSVYVSANNGYLFTINTATNTLTNTQNLGPLAIFQAAGNFIGSGVGQCPPSISSFTPTTVSTGNTVTITGSNFTGATAVSFGGAAAASFSVVNATTITAVVGSGASGSVSVTTPGGTASLAGLLVCNLSVSLSNTGSTTCINAALLSLTGATDATQIIWNNNGSPVSTVTQIPSPNGVVAAGANGQGSALNQLNSPNNIFIDASGNLFIADGNFNSSSASRIIKFPAGSTAASSGVVVAGTGTQGSALNQFAYDAKVFVDASGNIYVGDNINQRVLKFPSGSTSGTNATIIAGGNGNGSALNKFSSIDGIFVDGSGNLFVADAGNARVVKFAAGSTQATNGTVVAQSGLGAFGVRSVFVNSAGLIYVADAANYRILTFPASSTASTAGTVVAGGNGNGSAQNQLSNNIGAIYVDATGTIYIPDVNNHRVQKWLSGATTGTTVAGGNGIGSAANQLAFPRGVWFDAGGVLYVSDANNNRIQKYPLTINTTYSPTTGGNYTATVTNSAGCSTTSNAVTITSLVTPSVSITANPSGAICAGTSVTFTATPTNGGTTPAYQWQKNGNNVGTNSTTYTDAALVNGDIITCILTSNDICASVATATSSGISMSVNALPTVTVTGSTCTNAVLTATVSSGTVAQFTWLQNGSVVAVNTPSSGTVGTVVAGGSLGSGLNQLNGPTGLFTDASGNVYVTDRYNSRVVKWAPGATAGIVVAGGNGAGTGLNQLSTPIASYVDASGNVYVSEYGNNRVTKWVTGAASGVVVAGGNGAGAGAAQLNGPHTVYLDNAGNIYVADQGNSRVQKWAPGASSGTTVAGGNGNGAAANQISAPQGIFVDGSQNVYIADLSNNRIQKWAPGASAGTTVAGGNGSGSGANQLATPIGVYVDNTGNVYVADYNNQRIQKWASGATSGTTVAGGNGSGTALNQLSGPLAVNVAADGSLYTLEEFNNRVLKFATQNSNQYTASSAGNYSATVLSTAGCTATGNTITVNSSVTPTISITALAGNTICSGTSATFTATRTNAGTTPLFQWKKNGNIVGASSATYADAALVNNDVITCALTSNATCANPVTVTSNAITMIVNPLPAVGINVSPVGTICEGTPVTLNGTGAASYTWSSGVVNGVPFIPAGSNPFSTKIDFAAGTAPQEIAMDDVDGDGKKDLVVANFQSNSISVFRNTSVAGSLSNSSYAAKVDFATGLQPFGLAIEDIDGDGKKDILVANSGSNTISVYRNTSVSGDINSSSLAAKVDFSSASIPYGIVTADIDADGKKDVVVSTSGASPSISIFKNNSTAGSITAGSLAARVDFTANTGVRGIAVDDIDGDGKPDVVASNYASNKISIFKNSSVSGSITNTSLDAKVDFATGAEPYSVAIGDIDGDGKKEIAYVSPSSGAMGVFRNTSSAGIINSASLSSVTEFLPGSFRLYLAIGDINGDGKNDIVVTNASSNTFSYYKNTASVGSISSSSFSPAASFATGNNPRGICIGDIDGDGKNDVAIANNQDNTVSIFGGQSANYTVTGTGANGCTNTSTVTLLFNSKPVFNIQPAATVQSVCVGSGTQSLSVAAIPGSGTLSGYQWYSNNTASNTGGSLIAGAITSSYNPPSTTAGTFYYYCIASNSNGCTSSSNVSGAVIVSACAGNFWTGTVSNDWNVAGNWSNNLVPSAITDASIPFGNVPYPVLSVSSSIHNLTIDAGATVGIGANTFTINGTVTGTGTLSGSATSGLITNATTTVRFTAGANTLKNLDVNAGITTLASALNITAGTALNTYGTVTVANGATLASNGNLNIKSNQFGTARVAAGATGGNYITGDVTVERYIPANSSKAWRLLSVPTKGTKTIKQTWQENQAPGANGLPGFGTQITANLATLAIIQAAGFDAFSQAGSAMSYNSGTQAWTYLTSTNSSPIETQKGYFLYIRGSRAVSPSNSTAPVDATVLRTTGTLYMGDNTPAISVAAGKFEPVGNTYASAVDFTSLSKTGTLTNSIYVWDSKLIVGNQLGAYQTFVGALGFTPATNGGSYPAGVPNTTIESGQAIMVGAPAGGGGTIKLVEAAKTTGNQLNPFRPAAQPAQFRTSLYKAGNTTVFADNNIVVFDNAYSNATDANDAVKIAHGGENLDILTDNKSLLVDARQPVTERDVIHYSLKNLQPQTYKLSFTTLNMNTSGLTAFVEDKYLHTTTAIDLNSASEYTFTVDVNNTASSATDRLSVVFKKAGTVPVSDTKPAITVSPNPVEGNVASLRFSNQPKGWYTMRLLNPEGKLILARKILHNGDNISQEVGLPVTIANGIYKLEIIRPGNMKEMKSLFLNRKK